MNVSGSTNSVNYSKNIQPENKSLSGSKFMEQLGEEIASLFESTSDPEFEGFLKEMRNKYAGTQISEYKSRDEINDEDSALQKFKNDLITKGALRFLYDFNMEKIEEMVEKYKQKLLQEMENNPELDLDIDKMVAEYKKQLLERLAELDDEDKKSVINVNRLEFEIANQLNTGLEEVLQKV